MAKKSRILAFMLALLTVVSCTPRTVLLPSSNSTSLVDREKEVYISTFRDTTLKVEMAKESKSNALYVADSAKKAPAGLFNSTLSHLTTAHAESNAWVENGILRHNLFTVNEAFEQRLPNAIKEIRIDKYRYINRTKTVRITVTVNVLTDAQQRWIKAGKTALGMVAMLIMCVAGYFFLKIRK